MIIMCMNEFAQKYGRVVRIYLVIERINNCVIFIILNFDLTDLRISQINFLQLKIICAIIKIC
jgi:hypothetical protein